MKKIIIIILFFLFSSICFGKVKIELPCNPVLLNAARELAEKQVGVRELTGKNDGKQIDDYLEEAGYKRKSKLPYCMSGPLWCFRTSAKNLGLSMKEVPLLRSGSTVLVFNNALKKGKKVKFEPEEDNLLFWINQKRNGGHVEWITAVGKAGWLDTIGFNTTSSNKGRQEDGHGVFYRKRNILHVLGRMTVRGLIGFDTNI